MTNPQNRLYSALLLPVLAAAGCSRFHSKPEGKYVYVTAKSAYLRDRVAAVSNRVATVNNGDKLIIIGSNRRWYQVQTDKGEKGWVDERTVATQQVADEFEQVKADHKNDRPVAIGTVRDDVYLHSAPGRDTDRFYRLEEGDKLQLIARASTPKPVPPGPPVAKDEKSTETPPPPPMEDWWLVRTGKGQTGWMLSRMMDVDVADAVARYAEGQRIVAAYVLNTVEDQEIEGDNKNVPNYVTAMSPYKAGLPYDYDQLRVFTWNLKKHRYETAQRDKNIAGYLPIALSTDPGTPASPGHPGIGPAPAYTYKVLAEGEQLPQLDPKTGLWKPSRLVAKTYRLEGNLVKRVLAPGTQPPTEYHLVAEEKKAKAAKKRK